VIVLNDDAHVGRDLCVDRRNFTEIR